MAEEKKFVPYVPADTSMPELTLKALLLGVVMAIVLGAANAYLGLKAGMTISASFPAAVIAIAAFRLPFFRLGWTASPLTSCLTSTRGAGSGRRERRTAARIARLPRPATITVARSPRVGMSRKPAAQVPVTAPRVFTA